jgi:hypothetical protein
VTASERDTLSKIQMIASITSAVAIPLVIAAVGWIIQAKIASQSVQKDYVSMAVSILTDPKNDPITGTEEVKPAALRIKVSGTLSTARNPLIAGALRSA